MKILIFFLFITNFLYANISDYEIDLLKAANSLAYGKFNEGFEYINSAMLKSPENPRIKLYSAILLTIKQDYASSQVILFKTFKKPQNKLAEFYKYYNYFFLRENLTTQGQKKLMKIKNFLIKNKEKLDVAKLNFISISLYLQKDTQNSIKFLKEAIRKNNDILSLDYILSPVKDIIYDIYSNLAPPRDHYYYDSLARLQILIGDNKNAVKTLKTNLEKEKGDVLAKKLLSEAYLNLKDYDNSLKYLKDIKKFYATKEEIYLNMSKIYEIKKDYQKAFDICKEGSELLSSSPALRFCYTKGLYRLKKYKSALYHLEYLLKQSPDSYDVLMLAGDILTDFGKVLAFEHDPLKKRVMGEEYFKKFPEAIEFYVRAYGIKPGDIKVLEKLLNFINDFKEKNQELREKPEIEIQKGMKKFMKYYEPLIEKQTLEINNKDFYKYFKLFLKTKDEKYFKNLAYNPIGKTILKYSEYIKTKDEKILNDFMKKYSQKYLLILKNKLPLNKFVYKYLIEKEQRQLEEVKVFDFILPSYFD